MNLKAIKKITLVLMIALLAMIVHITVTAVSLYHNIQTSFPWHTAFLIPGVYYYIPILLLLVLYIILRKRQ